MVICKYFQNGNCRFGTKCINEHFDIKPIIKSEVEAAIKGNQWPLSCFGPFKEKPSIPNFIEDQSFEEVRLLCYEAKKQNCFPAFHQQFTQQVIEAKNKMEALLSLNRDVIEIVTNVYNSVDTSNTIQQQKGNSFSLNNNSTNLNQNSNIFDNKTMQSNAFSNGNNSVFGGNTNMNSNLFGNSSATTNKLNMCTGGILNQSNFGMNFGNSQRGMSESTFGNQQNGFNQPGGNIFNTSSNTQQFQNQNTLMNNNFGGKQIFSSTNQTNVFGQPQQQSAQNSNNLFTNQTQQSSLFSGCFNQPQQQSSFGMKQTSTPNGPFGQLQQNQQNIFGQISKPQQQEQNLFGVQSQNNQNLFNNQQNSNFGFQNTISDIRNVQQQFQHQQQFQLQQQTSGNLFGQIQHPQIGYQQENLQNQQFNGTQNNENLFSKIEVLTPEEIEAFKADKFILGQIPTSPPPLELL